MRLNILDCKLSIMMSSFLLLKMLCLPPNSDNHSILINIRYIIHITIGSNRACCLGFFYAPVYGVFSMPFLHSQFYANHFLFLPLYNC